MLFCFLHEVREVFQAVLPKQADAHVILHIFKVGDVEDAAHYGRWQHLSVPKLAIPRRGFSARIMYNSLVGIHR